MKIPPSALRAKPANINQLMQNVIDYELNLCRCTELKLSETFHLNFLNLRCLAIEIEHITHIQNLKHLAQKATPSMKGLKELNLNIMNDIVAGELDMLESFREWWTETCPIQILHVTDRRELKNVC